MRRSHPDVPLLITSAPVSSDAEYSKRRTKYAIMMGIRALCVLLAGLTYRFSIYLALAFIVGGMVLPWCAVLIANDGPVKKKRAQTGYRSDLRTERALPPGGSSRDDDRTVDG
jgi:hypothetical protein